MPRANRYIVPGRCYHVTHRCHNRAFLLRFVRDRNEYREVLRQNLDEVASVQLLNYALTSNHIHLLLRAPPDDPGEISRLMQLVQGQHAQSYNRRRKRHGAFWEDRFHATMIESGAHLWRCLTYIDLNMVRAGVVPHPREWEWTGYHELMGNRQRYRLIDLEAVQSAVMAKDLQEFRQHYQHAIEQRLAKCMLAREPQWTENIAVGGRTFVEEISRQLVHRQRLDTRPLETDLDTWALRDRESIVSPYV